MSLFDYVDFKCRCPNCNRMVTGFQSKDGDCMLNKVNISHVRSWNAKCICGTWLEFERYGVPRVQIKMISPKRRPAKWVEINHHLDYEEANK